MKEFEHELNEMKNLQKYLSENREHINSTVKRKMASLEL